MSEAPGRDASAAAPAVDRDARTRDQVLRRISEMGPVTAARLADALGLTSAGVRRHLDHLAAAGLIATSDAAAARRGRGRPARSYVVTSTGHASLSSRYDDVAMSALQFVSDRFGEEAVTDFARDRLATLEARYAPIVDAAGDDLTDRAAALAEALAADGYAASARPVGTGTGSGPVGPGLQLCQGHCPMHAVAARFPQFCDEETEVFARLLGVHVQRLATLAGGEHVCTTFVPGGAVPLGEPTVRVRTADSDAIHTSEQEPPAHDRHDEGSTR